MDDNEDESTPLMTSTEHMTSNLCICFDWKTNDDSENVKLIFPKSSKKSIWRKTGRFL